MTKQELLENARINLKKDFIGLDEIIDRVIEMITPWYLTPEIIERPTIISLWGLTGTGKTSLTRKLIKYLGLTQKSLFFDCGEQIGGDSSRYFSDKLNDLFETTSISEEEYKISKESLDKMGIKPGSSDNNIRTSNPLDYTFIFDEFQYLKTKDESNSEIDRPESRAIWNLMDSGLVDINSYSYKAKQLKDYIEDLEYYSQNSKSTIINNGRFTKEESKNLKLQLSYYRWADDSDYTGDDEVKDGSTGYPLLYNEENTFLVKNLNLYSAGLGYKVSEKIKSFKKLQEYINYIKPFIDLVTRPKLINCSKSLIFVLGNLDEAFGLRSDDNLDPDVDADVYHEMTKKVNILDIKKALRKRFRDEQVGRLGNNVIIYPSLRKRDFIEIIDQELERISLKFKNKHGIILEFTDNLKKFIYSEGVMPIFGIRQVFTTINSYITPLISKIVLETPKPDRAVINVASDNFETDFINLYIEYHKGSEITRTPDFENRLNLGSIRNPKNCVKLALQGIHEASHSVLYSKLTGDYPSAIIASSTLGGGFMMEHITSESNIDSVQELKNNIIISLAGYYGEREFFEESKCTLGSSSDINNVWEELSNAYYNCGFEIPLKYSNSLSTEENGGIPYGYEDLDVKEKLKITFNQLCEETKLLVKSEKRLILEMALYLNKNRCMSESVFKEYINKYGSGFNTESMKEIKEKTRTYYLDILKKIKEGL